VPYITGSYGTIFKAGTIIAIEGNHQAMKQIVKAMCVIIRHTTMIWTFSV